MHREPRHPIGRYQRIQLWVLRTPWVVLLFTLFAIAAIVLWGATPWRWFMLALDLTVLAMATANVLTDGRIERKMWPDLW